MVTHPDVPDAIVTRLRHICLAWPGVHEERAWAGTRWVVRKKNFAQVLHIEGGWPPAYAKAARCDGPVDVLTFRSPVAEFNIFSFAKPPFFRPGWWPDIVGLRLLPGTDWDEVELLLEASYRMYAGQSRSS